MNYALLSHRCHQKSLILFLLAFLILLVHYRPTNIIVDLKFIWCNSHSLHPLLRQSSQQYSQLSKWPNMLVLWQTLTENLSFDFYNRSSPFWNQHSFIHRTPQHNSTLPSLVLIISAAVAIRNVPICQQWISGFNISSVMAISSTDHTD